MKSVLKILIIWVTLLAVPLQGFASATMSVCALPPAAAPYDHDHESMAGADAFSPLAHDGLVRHDMHADHHPAAHHHSGKCTACGTCNACVSTAPPSTPVLTASATSSIMVPFDQRILPSVDHALPERPPRA